MWADNETNEDLLGYQVHADLLKEVVLDSTMLPITIGIFGDWGSGKSSLMLLMKEGIDQWMKEEANKKEKVAQIQFNSWQFENYEDTKLTLIETVLTAIEKDLKKKRKHPIKDDYPGCWGVATFASNTKSHDDKGRGRPGDCLLRREQDQLQTAPV